MCQGNEGKHSGGRGEDHWTRPPHGGLDDSVTGEEPDLPIMMDLVDEDQCIVHEDARVSGGAMEAAPALLTSMLML